MVRLNRISTRTGDGGDTGLGDGSRAAKDSARIGVIGSVDEANAVLGVARLDLAGGIDSELPHSLMRIQNDMFDLGADLCVPLPPDEEEGHETKQRLRISVGQVERLECEIDAMNESLAPLTSFILPGGTATAAYLHLARTVVRRAEREAWALARAEWVNPQALRYLNRLSDHLFVAARWVNARAGTGDVLWQPGAS